MQRIRYCAVLKRNWERHDTPFYRLRKVTKLGQKNCKSQNWKISPENSVSSKHEGSFTCVLTLIVTACTKRYKRETENLPAGTQKNDRKIPLINEEILALDSSASRGRINFY